MNEDVLPVREVRVTNICRCVLVYRSRAGGWMQQSRCRAVAAVDSPFCQNCMIWHQNGEPPNMTSEYEGRWDVDRQGLRP
jgi:hypothetical protein